jgi:hypothetical protein
VYLIFPVTSNYQPYYKAEVVWRGTYPKEVNIEGAPMGAPIGNVMENRVMDHNVTNLLDPQPEGNGFKQQFVINGNAPRDLAGVKQGLAGLSASNDRPAETINVKLDGISYDTLWPYISPAWGLTSFNITVDGEGMSTDLVFSSHPPKLPKRDVWMQKFNATSRVQRAQSATPHFNNHQALI